MTRKEYENSTFEELMEKLRENGYSITTYEELKEFAIDKINNDDLLMASHILDVLWKDTAKWYDYDYCMGMFDKPCSVTGKEDVEHMIYDADDDDYYTSATSRDYSPSNPWDAPGMSVKDFI